MTVGPAPADELVLRVAAIFVGHENHGSEAGDTVARIVSMHDRGTVDQVFELRDPRLVDGRLLEHRQKVVVVGGAAEAASVTEATGELGFVTSAERLEFLHERSVLGSGESVFGHRMTIAAHRRRHHEVTTAYGSAGHPIAARRLVLDTPSMPTDAAEDQPATAETSPVREPHAPTAEEMGEWSFPASDPPATWTWDVPRKPPAV